MKLNKKGEALGRGDKQTEAMLQNSAQRAVIAGVLPSWLGTARGALQGSGSVRRFY